jgi:hypothetical protein
MHTAEEAARKCIAYYQNKHASFPCHGGPLISYIADWLRNEGPDAVNGSFEVFVQTVIIIIDEWRRDPSLFDYRQVRSDGKLWSRKRRPSGIFNDDDERRKWILVPSWFNSTISAYYRWHCPVAPSA